MKTGIQKFHSEAERTSKEEEVKNRLLGNQDFRRAQRSKMLLYDYLKSKIVREPGQGLQETIYENYYLSGRLATSYSIRELAHHFGYSGWTQIQRYIKQLVNDGFIHLEEIHVGYPRPQNVFVLGVHDNEGELFFMEEIYLH